MIVDLESIKSNEISTERKSYNCGVGRVFSKEERKRPFACFPRARGVALGGLRHGQTDVSAQALNRLAQAKHWPWPWPVCLAGCPASVAQRKPNSPLTSQGVDWIELENCRVEIPRMVITSAYPFRLILVRTWKVHVLCSEGLGWSWDRVVILRRRNRTARAREREGASTDSLESCGSGVECSGARRFADRVGQGLVKEFLVIFYLFYFILFRFVAGGGLRWFWLDMMGRDGMAFYASESEIRDAVG